MLQTTFLYILWLDSVLALNFNFGFFWGVVMSDSQFRTYLNNNNKKWINE